MSQTHAMEFVQTPIQKTTPRGVMVISAMPSRRIIWFLVKRHKVGLLISGNVGFLVYLSKDFLINLYYIVS